jgi:pimeloyl-ACP methyl ester carboxylesterase
MVSVLLPCIMLLVSEPPPGVVFVAGGAGSIINLSGMTQWALRQKSSTLEVRDFPWSHGKGRVIRDIQDTRHLVTKAQELAREVEAYRQRHPDRPIYLMGRSTGAMVVLLAAEQLPAGTLERIILLSPAVSPEYDLQPALRSTKCKIISFRSSLDVAVLDWGTTFVGTADRFYTKSAGLSGFTLPAPGTPAATEYARLEQVAWKPGHIFCGHLGGHFGNGTPLFLLFEVTPYLTGIK